MSDDEIDNVIPLQRARDVVAARTGMIEMWEALHLHRGVSLTDPKVNAALRAAAEGFDLLVQGMHAEGQISEQQQNDLRWWVGTAINAADELG